jgi:subtilisin family serine protease
MIFCHKIGTSATSVLLIVALTITHAAGNDISVSKNKGQMALLSQKQQAARRFRIIKEIPRPNEPNVLIKNSRSDGTGEIIVKYRQNAAANLAGSTAANNVPFSASLDQLNQKYKIKRIEPVFKDFGAEKIRLQKLLTTDRKQLTPTEQKIRRRLELTGHKMQVPDLERIYKLILQTESGQDLSRVVAAYNQDPDVEYAQLNHKMSINSNPDDADYSVQWALHNTGQQYLPGKTGTAGCDIRAPQAWDISTGLDTVVVAVVDTGVDYKHRDMATNIWVNKAEQNGQPNVDDDGNGYIDDIHGYDFAGSDPCQGIVDSDPLDENGHGTHVAGIIGARGNNGTDIAGVNWRAKIMAAKFLDATGTGDDYAAIQAIKYSADNGADVLNCSWGPTDRYPSDPALEDVIDYAYSLGCITVFAAGNFNDDVAYYSPANYDKVISVVATDSSDQKASFSNYGHLAWLAAPGVDILSLRANGTALDTVYDDYTVFASGTSMACPYVAGACALMLSADPSLTFEAVRDILSDTVDAVFDPVDEVCASNGRLNLHRAMNAATPSHGYIHLDRTVYSCQSTIEIALRDIDLQGQGSCTIEMASDSGDHETVALSETSRAGWFEGAIRCQTGSAAINDAELQVVNGDVTTATYYDANDGTGNAATVEAAARIDCAGPVIANLQNRTAGSTLFISFETDEPALATVRCGLTCGGPYDIVKTNFIPSTIHIFQLSLTQPDTDYYFIIETADALGQTTIDDNNSLCYHFVSAHDYGEVNVPAQYPTIQAAIDSAWNNNIVLIADGIYAGTGNRDINFKGKRIIVKSRNGAAKCVVDCQHLGRGFLFYNHEDVDSVLDGITILNGYPDITKNPNPLTEQDRDRGAGIYCLNSSPVIRNCRVSGCMTGGGVGAGIFSTGGHPTLENCKITDNSGPVQGGGIAADGGLTVSNSIIARNVCISDGGAIFAFGGAIEITGSKIVANKTITNEYWHYGAGICCGQTDAEVKIIDCVISGNVSAEGTGLGGGAYLWDCQLTMQNCVVTNNYAYISGGVFHRGVPSAFTNCTFTQNSSAFHGSLNSGGYLYNTILWDNPTYGDYEITGDFIISHCDIKGGKSGVENPVSRREWNKNKNIDVNPRFAFTGDVHLMNNSRCINAGIDDQGGLLPASDLDGNPHSLNNSPDIGAYEFTRNSPSIAVSPTFILVNAVENGGPPEAQALSIRNCGGATLSWTIDENCDWLSVDKTSGSSNGKINDVTININQAGLAGGYHEAELIISDSSAVNTPRKVVVCLYVTGTLRVPSRYSTIKAAMSAARDGDVILVADGNYTGNGNRDITFDGKAITVKSENGPQTCIIDCAGSDEDPHRGFAFYLTNEDNNSVVDGFTIKNGYVNLDFLKVWPPMDGGAIYCFDSHPVILNCIIENSRAPLEHGGGMYVSASTGSARSYISNCVIRNNVAGADGGGIWIDDYADMANLLVYNNQCGNNGGGIYLGDTCNPLVNCTIVNNTANHSAAGLYVGGGAWQQGSQAKLTNSIVWGNMSEDGSQIKLIDYTPQDGIDSVLTVGYSDVEGGRNGVAADAYAILNWDASNLNSNPSLTEDCHLTDHSPCINAGDPNFAQLNETDIDGQPRVIGGRVDMGADEFVHAADFDFDGRANLVDLHSFVSDWLTTNCGKSNDWCLGADLDQRGAVDFADFAIFAQYWMDGAIP